MAGADKGQCPYSQNATGVWVGGLVSGGGKLKIGPTLGQKGEKRVKKWNFWPNASFLLVEIWQDLLENDFGNNDQDFGYRNFFIQHNLCNHINVYLFTSVLVSQQCICKFL